LFAAMLVAPLARGSDSVTAEIGTGQSRPTPAIQPYVQEYQKIVGRWDPIEALELSASIRLTRDFPAAAAAGTTLRTEGDWVWLGGLDASFDASTHFSFAMGLLGAPPSTRIIASPFTYPDGGNVQNSTALIRTKSWFAGGSVEMTYDTYDSDAAEDEVRPLDASVDASVGYTHYSTDQQMTAFDGPAGPTNVPGFVAACGTSRTPLCNVVDFASKRATAELEQVRIGATLTTTIYEHTDAALDAGYYLYSNGDPDSVGYAKVNADDARGRSVGTATYGAGLPLLPQRYTLRPEIGHKWTSFSARLWYQFTDYTSPDYIGHSIGTRLQLYLDTWRVYTTGSYRADVSDTDVGHTWMVGVGVTRVF
jgi:hypothetical protein